MRVRFDPATSNRDINVPRPISRQKIYKGRLGQTSASSDSSSGSSNYLANRIDEEEGEDNEMVLGHPSDVSDARGETSKTQSNGNKWFPDEDEYDSDKEEDEVTLPEPVVNEIGPQLPGLYDGYHQDENLPNSGIIVRVISPTDDDPITQSAMDRSIPVTDNELLIELRAREYRGNFDGFAEINRFASIDEMHEFIVNNTESSLTSEPSAKQERYLEILLNEQGEDRFKRLVETSKGTVRRVLSRNEHLLKRLYASACLDKFPSPLKINTNEEDNDLEDEEEEDDVERNDCESDEKMVLAIEENMKRWYMIEMIGIWLKFVTDVSSYREAIKKSVLKANCGIENDRFEGIVVPLKYK